MKLKREILTGNGILNCIRVRYIDVFSREDVQYEYSKKNAISVSNISLRWETGLCGK